jgi:hypothetical protein
MFAASYGILVNSKTYFAGTKVDEFEGFQQYLAHVQVAAGDKVQLCDAENRAVWAVDLNPASVEGFTREGDHYNVTVTGCYDFYIKLKYEADELYIGNGENCGEGIDISGGGNPGGQGGGTDEDVNYYAIGWINGEDHGERAYDTFEDEYMFENGKLTIECRMGSYIAVKDHMGNFYYAEGNDNATGNTVTLKWANGWTPCQKWAILEGTQYIIIREATFKGNIVLETVDKATYDAYTWGNSQGVEETKVSEKAHKVMVDGQLRIVRGDKMFDATGREL